MKNFMILLVLVAGYAINQFKEKPDENGADYFPDGTPPGEWFFDSTGIDPESLGKEFIINAYGFDAFTITGKGKIDGN